LTVSPLLGNNPPVIPLRVAKALCALAAMCGLAGLSVLPAEHVHSHADDATTHHAALIHRHFAGHHGTGIHAKPDLPSVRQALDAGDDHENARTIQVFFTAGTRVDRQYAPSAVIQSDTDLYDVPSRALTAAFLQAPQPYISPPGLSSSLRGPPVIS
jgi:hypothetical protein